MSNTTPFIALARIGRLDLLERVFGRVLLPAVVAAELGAANKSDLVVDVGALAWVTVVDMETPDAIAARLDAGEAAAIALAIREKASVVLLDEQRARKVAKAMKLPVAGTFMVLLRAKWAGHVVAVRPLIDQLLATGFHASPTLVGEMLRRAGESP
ncbi:MAG: DUF3368 domain-containing protein [Deltaproteobacteria bacterium]|nr:DUF3368 domain-containing protein [Deltaproteobacteria bacterium]